MYICMYSPVLKIINLRQMAYPERYFEMAITPQVQHKLVACNMYTVQVLTEGWMRQCQSLAISLHESCHYRENITNRLSLI